MSIRGCKRPPKVDHWSKKYDPNYIIVETSNCDSYGGPKVSIEDKKNHKCSKYAKNGYRCVPFYACKGVIFWDKENWILHLHQNFSI